MLVASAAGIIGYPLFVSQFDPDPTYKSKRILAFCAVCLIGISQIGAIVCSLGILSNGVLQHSQNTSSAVPSNDVAEREPLLSDDPPKTSNRGLAELKGSVAGVYSFYGGAGILILTKIGGLLFDKVSVAAPFHIMASFNGILFIACIFLGPKIEG
jgi:hypothetical protein